MSETERKLFARPAQASAGTVPARALPAYQQIKRYVVERIAKGDWKPGAAIPTEAELVKEFGVARMTVSRALRELTAERVLTRIQGGPARSSSAGITSRRCWRSATSRTRSSSAAIGTARVCC